MNASASASRPERLARARAESAVVCSSPIRRAERRQPDLARQRHAELLIHHDRRVRVGQVRRVVRAPPRTGRPD